MNFVKAIVKERKAGLERTLKMEDNRIKMLEEELVDAKQSRVITIKQLEDCNKFLNI